MPFIGEVYRPVWKRVKIYNNSLCKTYYLWSRMFFWGLVWKLGVTQKVLLPACPKIRGSSEILTDYISVSQSFHNWHANIFENLLPQTNSKYLFLNLPRRCQGPDVTMFSAAAGPSLIKNIAKKKHYPFISLIIV